ncbi:MAG: amidohydrolase family protein [Marinifilaceae bacterium]
MEKKRIDSHCHVFNKDILTKRILLQILCDLESIVFGRRERGFFDFLKKIKETTQQIIRITKFIKIGFKDNSTEVYKVLQGKYLALEKEKYIVTPLMLDIGYCFAEPDQAQRSFLDQYNNQDQILNDEIRKIQEELETYVMDLAQQASTQYSTRSIHLLNKEDNETYKDLLEAVDYLLDVHKELKTATEPLLEEPDNIEKFRSIFKDTSSFETQITQMLQLSENPEYKNLVYPFFSVDPRRPDALQLVKQYVGPNKKFAGVKLYCPLGYSPTDPILFGSPENEDCIYKYCQNHNIPITAHCSDGGFATFAQKVKITGYIYLENEQGQEEVQYVKDQVIDFGSSVLGSDNKGAAIQKRARILNHPLIWEKVFEKYNNLTLNLAHFGGEDARGEWRPTIYSIIQNPDYPNAYTDLSCFSDEDRLKEVKEEYFDKKQEVKCKFLYGSDFYLLELFENRFRDYLNDFKKEIFKQDFDLISIENPRNFMESVFEVQKEATLV